MAGTSPAVLLLAAAAGLLAAAWQIGRGRSPAGLPAPSRALVTGRCLRPGDPSCLGPVDATIAGLTRRLAPAAGRVGALRRAGAGRVLHRRCLLVGGRSIVVRAAGDPSLLDTDALIDRLAAQRLAGLAAAAVIGLLAAAASGDLGAPVALALAGVGLLLPDVLLARAWRGASGRLDADLPGCLDLVAGWCSAGRPMEAALAAAAAHCDPPLAAIVGRALTRHAAGQSVAAALLLEADRAGAARLAALAATLERHQRLGRPIAKVILEMADAERSRRAIDYRMRSGRALTAASLLTAAVVTPACVAALGLLIAGGLLASGLF